MSSVSENWPIHAAVPASRGLRWSIDGLRLWRRAPLKLFLLCLVPLLIEGLLQLIPLIGMTLSKLVVPILLMGVLLGLDELAQGRRLRWSCLLAGLRHRHFLSVLALAAMWGLGVFAVQQAAVWAVYGWPAVDAVWLGRGMDHPALMTLQFQRTLLLPGLLPSVLLMLAPGLFLFAGCSPWQAVRGSACAAWRFAAPFGVFLLISIALFALMLTASWTFALALLFGPWGTACMYTVWRDLRPVTSAPVAAG